MTPERMRRLLASAEATFREEFVAIVTALRSELPLRRLEDLLARGRVDDAVDLVGRVAERLGAVWGTVYLGAAAAGARYVGGPHARFDPAAERAVAALRRNRLRLVRALTEQQRAAFQGAISDGIRAGLNPREQARALRDSLGLTDYQERVVRNYRRELERASPSALERELRDRRSDRAVLRAAEAGQPLPAAQVDAMVERYRRAMVALRAETIARTEALRSVHEGSEEMLAQAVERGLINPAEVERTWYTAADARVRDSHSAMAGQVRPWGQPFQSGDGNALRYPGDPDAPAGDTINCRCAVGTRLLEKPAATP